MRFIAAIDTVIYGRRYAQGSDIDITGWTRRQILQFLDKGLMQASQVTAGMILEAMVFEGADVTSFSDANGKLHIVMETTPRDLDWLLDVDSSMAEDGMVLGYDSRSSTWTPRPVQLAIDVGGLSDVNVEGIQNNDALYWDAPSSTWKARDPFFNRHLDDLHDVDASNPGDGMALLFDYSSRRWYPGNASSVPGPQGPVTWAIPEPWDPGRRYTVGPPASVVTYQGSAYLALTNNSNISPAGLNNTDWRLIVAKGDKGDKGDVGPASTIPGPQGPPNTLAIGTVTTVTNPSPASATVTGSSPNQTLNLVIPKGQDGNQGLQGPAGKAIPAGGTLSVLGPVQVAAGNLRLYNDTGVALTISKVRLAVSTAPTGQALIVDVKKDGVSIFPTTPKPQIAAAANTGTAVPDVTAWADGSYLTVDITQVGATVPGSNLTVTVVAG
jgi:hypothetical protein